jgi:hypothetical protein
MRPVMILMALLLLIAGRAHAEPALAPDVQQGGFAVASLWVEAQAGAERMVREIPAGLTNAQVWGIAAGIVAGAFVADLLGGTGLVTLGLAAAGGATGNWLLSM